MPELRRASEHTVYYGTSVAAQGWIMAYKRQTMRVSQRRIMMGSTKPVTLGESIIRTLKEYGAVRIDFVARVLGRPLFEVQEYVSALENVGAIKRDGDMISIASS